MPQSYSYLLKRLAKDPNRSFISGKADQACMMVHCAKSGASYITDLSSAKAIMSGASAIHPAYKLDPKTGNPYPEIYAAKIFSGGIRQNLRIAKNELTALSQHAFAEMAQSPLGKPIILSYFHQGSTLCHTNGKPNFDILDRLSISQRVDLVLQIITEYQHIHQKKENKSAWIHADVKGANIIVDVNVTPPKARVIDFGSAKQLQSNEPSESVETGLAGLSHIMIPPEAIANAQHYADVNETTGHLSRASDIYALAPLIAILLGAKNPYAHRDEKIEEQVQNTGIMYNIYKLKQQIDQGFCLEDTLQSIKIPGDLHVPTPTAFYNRQVQEAPNQKTILNDHTLQSKGFILYKNELLFFDKIKKLVTNRRNLKPKVFAEKIANIENYPDTQSLTSEQLYEINKICTDNLKEQYAIDIIVRPLVVDFLNRMTNLNTKERPGIDDVLRFFKVIHDLIALSEIALEAEQIAIHDRTLMVKLIELNIILFDRNKIQFTFENDQKNESEKATFADYDFSVLINDTATFQKLNTVFKNRYQCNDDSPLQTEEFSFLTFKKKVASQNLQFTSLVSQSTSREQNLSSMKTDPLASIRRYTC